MRVGVDATAVANRHGDGRFARNAIRRLVELDPATEYVLHLDDRSAAEFPPPAGARVRRLPLRPESSVGLAAHGTRPLGDLLRMSVAASRGNYDAFLFPSLVTYVPALGTPTVVGLHDAHVQRFGALVLPTRRARAAWRGKQAFALRRATRVFTVSQAARAELAGATRTDPDRLAVVPEAPAPVFSPRSPVAARRAIAPLGPLVGREYLLYASGINPHKSPETLLEACAALRAAGRPCPPLVMVGPLDDDTAHSAAAAVRARIAALGLQEHVLLPGHVDDEVLASLYSAATAVVVPSLGEGFGLPAVEAAACGAPVVLSDIPAHRESLGDAALRFAPGDASALAAELDRLLGDDALRRSLSERGRRRVAPLTWDRTATELRRLIGEAAATRRRRAGR
jgi:glycosyltransferase involved in cell wall biosynthesis